MEAAITFLLTYVATCYGTVLWMALHLAATKDDYDDVDQDFPWIAYKKKTWDNWLVAIVAIPFVAHFGEEAVSLFIPGLVWSKMGYALSGLISQHLYFLFKKYRKGQK
jgi:hypothetical protein